MKIVKLLLLITTQNIVQLLISNHISHTSYWVAYIRVLEYIYTSIIEHIHIAVTKYI